MSMIDALLEFDSMHYPPNTVAGPGSLVCSSIIDLGDAGMDTWGSGKYTYPASWTHGELQLNVHSVSVPYGSFGYVFIKLVASNVATDIPTAEPIITSQKIDMTPLVTPSAKLWQVAVPRHPYRYMGLRYYVYAGSSLSVNFKVSAWISLDSEFGVSLI